MNSITNSLDITHKLNRVFSYIVVYYWLLIYVKTPSYIMITLPIALFIVYSLLHIKNFFIANEAYFILLFIFFSACLSLIRLDFTTLIAVSLFGLLIFVVNNFRLKISLNLINSLFIISILLSIPLYYSGQSIYGFIPGQGGYSNMEALSGRVSLFSSVTVSIYFSFIIFFINYFYNKNSYQKILLFILTLYFIYFGISRTVMIVLSFILLFSGLLKLYPLRKNWFYQILMPTLLIGLPILFIVFIEDILYFLLNLNSDFISEYFFRGYNTVDKILDDIARTHIWSEHIRLFKEYPWGLSTSEIELYKNIHLSDGGSESFLTKILVRFGFGAIFFYFFIFSLLNRAINEENSYLYIFIYIFIFIGINYGSFFAAYNVLFMIFISSINNETIKKVGSNV